MAENNHTKIKVGIIGATGYAGAELVRILQGHPAAEIKWYGSRSYMEKEYASVYRNFFRVVEDICKGDDLKELAEQVDVIFTATPQGFLASVISEEILGKVKVVDLSADFRLKDVAVMKSGMESSIRRRSLSGRRSMGSARSTGRISEGRG